MGLSISSRSPGQKSFFLIGQGGVIPLVALNASFGLYGIAALLSVEPVPPAKLYDFELFGLGLQLGGTLYFLRTKNLRPFLSGSYFTSVSNFKLQRGYASNSVDSFQSGKIYDKGLLLTVGTSLNISQMAP